MAALEKTAIKFYLSSSQQLLRRRYLTRQQFIIRYATTIAADVSSALRPFYFAVHPDLFGQHPNERAVNEASLQQLSSYIETVQQKRTPSPTRLRFFLRQKEIYKKEMGFREVKINLASRDIRQVVISVLKTCSLPTTSAEKIPSSTLKEPLNFVREKYKPFEGGSEMEFELRETIIQKRAANTLLLWLKENWEVANARHELAQPAREEALRRSEDLAGLLQLSEVRWECGWNHNHYIGCLQSVEALVRDHSDIMTALKGRTLVFGNETGVSLDGYVIFNSGEVRHNWLEFVKKISQYDITLRRIPSLEKSVSGILRDIGVVRRKFQQRVLVSEYESQLRRLATTLGDYTGKRGFPATWPEKMKTFKLVIETAAGPLMLSPTGQFIVPSSCPAFLLVSFLTDNMEEASKRLQKYSKQKQREEELTARTIDIFGLRALRKDDAITPERMAVFCDNLLSEVNKLQQYLRGSELRVTHYYSVLSDGEICVPWDFNI